MGLPWRSILSEASILLAVSATCSPQTEYPLEWQNVNTAVVSLGGSAVTAVVGDKSGNIWLGTHHGLARFSKGTREIFTSSNSKLPDNDVQQLISADDGIWIRTSRNIARLSGKSWLIPDLREIGEPTAIRETKDGTFWAGGKKLARFERGKWVFTDVKFSEDIHSPTISCIFSPQPGILWVGTYAGLFSIAKDGSTSRVPGLEDFDAIVHDVVTGANSTIWIGSDKGLAELSGGRLLLHNMENGGLPSDDVTSITLDGDGSIWAVTKQSYVFNGLNLLPWYKGSSGIVHVSPAGWEIITPTEGGIPRQELFSILADGESVWLATQVGLFRGSRSRWQNLNLPLRTAESLVGMKRGMDGSLWCVTNFAVDVLLPSGQWVTPLEVKRATDLGGEAIAMSDDGRYSWISFGGNLYQFDSRHPMKPLRTLLYPGESRITRIAIRGDEVLFPDVEGLWAVRDGKVVAAFPDETGISSVADIAVKEHSDVVAIATRGAGIFVSEGNEIKKLKSTNPQRPLESANSLAFAQDGTLWVGGDDGISHVSTDGRITESYTVENSPLPSNMVWVVAIAPDQSVWIGTTEGLAHLRDGNWEVYDGSNSELPGGISHILIDSDSTLWVGGGQNGIARFRPPIVKPQVVELTGNLALVDQERHTFGVLAYDPSFRTGPEAFRFHWTLAKNSFFDLKTETQDFYTSTPFLKLDKLTDGVFDLRVIAIDRYGLQSEAMPHRFRVSIARPALWKDALRKVVTSGIALYAVSFVLLLVVIPFYSNSSLIRTAINSGVFTKFSLLHKTILSTNWARRYIFVPAISHLAALAKPPLLYIPQEVTVSTDTASIVDADNVASLLDAVFTEVKSAIVIGKSGSGKSVLLQHIFRESAQAFMDGVRNEIPVLVNLRTEWVEGQTVVSLIRNIFAGENVELPEDVFTFLIQKGGFLFLLDSLNEVVPENVKRTFYPFTTANSRNRLLFAGQTDLLQRPQTKVCGLNAVTPEQARQYLSAVVGRDVWEELPIEAKKLAENPQNLDLLGSVISSSNAEIPIRRADLYRSIFDQDSAMKQLLGGDTANLEAVYFLAYRMIDDLRYTLSFDEAQDLVRRTGADSSVVLSAIRKSKMFRDEQRRNLAGINEPALSFVHETMGKFLASRYLRAKFAVNQPDSLELRSLANQHRFADVFYFFLDELTSRRDLNSALHLLIHEADALALKIVAYAIATKPTGIVDSVIVNAFTKAQVASQTQEAGIELVTTFTV
jgi:ligand-binding sensor domain-containing protein